MRFGRGDHNQPKGNLVSSFLEKGLLVISAETEGHALLRGAQDSWTRDADRHRDLRVRVLERDLEFTNSAFYRLIC